MAINILKVSTFGTNFAVAMFSERNNLEMMKNYISNYRPKTGISRYSKSQKKKKPLKKGKSGYNLEVKGLFKKELGKYLERPKPHFVGPTVNDKDKKQDLYRPMPSEKFSLYPISYYYPTIESGTFDANGSLKMKQKQISGTQKLLGTRKRLYGSKTSNFTNTFAKQMQNTPLKFWVNQTRDGRASRFRPRNHKRPTSAALKQQGKGRSFLNADKSGLSQLFSQASDKSSRTGDSTKNTRKRAKRLQQKPKIGYKIHRQRKVYYGNGSKIRKRPRKQRKYQEELTKEQKASAAACQPSSIVFPFSNPGFPNKIAQPLRTAAYNKLRKTLMDQEVSSFMDWWVVRYKNFQLISADKRRRKLPSYADYDFRAWWDGLCVGDQMILHSGRPAHAWKQWHLSSHSKCEYQNNCRKSIQSSLPSMKDPYHEHGLSLVKKLTRNFVKNDTDFLLWQWRSKTY